MLPIVTISVLGNRAIASILSTVLDDELSRGRT